MAACRSPGPIDKELARQLQPSMDSTTTVQQFRHHYLRFHSLQKILHAHQPSLLQDSCSTLLQETQAHGNNSRGFFGEDNVSDACSGKDGGLSSLLAMEQALHIHFSGASHDVHCCQADVDHSMNDCGCPTVSLKCHEKKTSFRVRCDNPTHPNPQPFCYRFSSLASDEQHLRASLICAP